MADSVWHSHSWLCSFLYVVAAVQPIGADAPEITARFRDPAGSVIGLYQQPA